MNPESNTNDPSSTDTDSSRVRLDGQLARVFKGVAGDVCDGEHGAVKATANEAALRFLEDVDPDVVAYNLGRHGYDDLDSLRRTVEANQIATVETGEE